MEHGDFGLQLGRPGSGHVEDVFFADGAMEVVGAVAEGDLRQLQAQTNPVGGEVREVVQVDAADGDGAERIKAGGGRLDRDGIVLRLVGQGDERRESPRLVLQGPELAQVIHPVGQRLDVAIEHGAGAASAHPVPGPMHLQVFLG